jgi:hypothetical protein
MKRSSAWIYSIVFAIKTMMAEERLKVFMGREDLHGTIVATAERNEINLLQTITRRQRRDVYYILHYSWRIFPREAELNLHLHRSQPTELSIAS